MANVKVRVWQDRMGNIIGQPHRDDLSLKIANHMKEMTGHPTYRFFFQEGDAAQDFLASCSPKQRKNIEEGYDAVILVDPWIMGHWYGWDTHKLFE